MDIWCDIALQLELNTLGFLFVREKGENKKIQPSEDFFIVDIRLYLNLSKRLYKVQVES